MPYEPTNWKNGDVVTSAKLNKLEKGVEDAGDLFVVGYSDEEKTTLDKTYNEILSAMLAGKLCILFSPSTGTYGDTNVNMAVITEAAAQYGQDAVIGYSLAIAGSEYWSDTADGYPVLDS